MQPAATTASLAGNGQHNDSPGVPALSDGPVMPDAAGIRKLMGENLGIMRTTPGIGQALDQLERWRRLLAQTTGQDWTPTRLDLRNRLDCAWLIAACAAQRKESRGLHALTDFPQMLAEPGPSVIGRPMQPMPVPAQSEPG